MRGRVVRSARRHPIVVVGHDLERRYRRAVATLGIYVSLVEERVIDNAKSVDFSNDKQDSDRLQQWLESLDPDDMGKYKM